MRRPRVLALLLGGFLATTAFPATQQTAPNGISVGPAKVFDNRSLVIMLEQLEKQLQSIRVVEDQKSKLLEALATFQGARITEVARALSLSGPVGEDATPAAPETPEVPSTLAMSPTFGVKAEDLLSDQISLTYQIVNVRLLLERALSDRLLADGSARLQAVLGFQVSIDPPRDAKDKAAFVELTVSSADGSPVSVVSVMPYEKTYNAYAIDRRENAFGGAAIAKVLSLGYSEQRGSETLYVYKDADTLALGNALPRPESANATFGWEFRPVLGRKSVAPGLRQMFAVIALPAEDTGVTQKRLSITARTFWRRYDAGKATTRLRDEYVVPAGLGSVDVLTTGAIQRHLGPVITDVQWRATDENTAVVTVAGKNLFTGTSVVLGSKTYDSPATGLTLKSDQLMELRTTRSELVFGSGAVSGRYGGSVALEAVPAKGSGILINSVTHKDLPGREFLPVDIVLQARDGSALDLRPEEPVIAVGTQLARNVYAQPVTCIPIPPYPNPIPPHSKPPSDPHRLERSVTLKMLGPSSSPRPSVQCWRFTGIVPTAALHKEPSIVVSYPLRGDAWRDSAPIDEPSAVTGVTRLGGAEKTRLAITGRGFNDQWRLILDQPYVATESRETLMLYDVDSSVLGKFKKLVVRPPAGESFILDIDPKPAPPSPKLDPDQKKHVAKETAASVTFTGRDLQAIKTAKFEDKPLPIQVRADGGQITIYLSRTVTAKPGEVVVLLESDGGLVAVSIVVDP